VAPVDSRCCFAPLTGGMGAPTAAGRIHFFMLVQHVAVVSVSLEAPAASRTAMDVHLDAVTQAPAYRSGAVSAVRDALNSIAVCAANDFVATSNWTIELAGEAFKLLLRCLDTLHGVDMAAQLFAKYVRWERANVMLLRLLNGSCERAASSPCDAELCNRIAAQFHATAASNGVSGLSEVLPIVHMAPAFFKAYGIFAMYRPQICAAHRCEADRTGSCGICILSSGADSFLPSVRVNGGPLTWGPPLLKKGHWATFMLGTTLVTHNIISGQVETYLMPHIAADALEVSRRHVAGLPRFSHTLMPLSDGAALGGVALDGSVWAVATREEVQVTPEMRSDILRAYAKSRIDALFAHASEKLLSTALDLVERDSSSATAIDNMFRLERKRERAEQPENAADAAPVAGVACPVCYSVAGPFQVLPACGHVHCTACTAQLRNRCSQCRARFDTGAPIRLHVS